MMDRARGRDYRGGMTIGTRLSTWLHGRLVGSDEAGNRYFEDKRLRPGQQPRRWVLYAGEPEASSIPPEWHAWMHYTTNEPIPIAARKHWQKPHQANQTGTANSYRPPGHDYRGGHRAPATGDYESWTPGS